MAAIPTPAFDARKLRIKSPAYQAGYTPIASPETAPLRWITFGRLVLNAGQRQYEASTGSSELVFDLFSGRVSVEVRGASGTQSFQLGERADAFSGSPSMLYIPAGCEYRVDAGGGEAVASLFYSPAPAGGVAQHVTPAEALVKDVGRDNWTRKVMTSVSENVPAHSLIVGETVNPAGNWSSAPPHKHDRSRPPHEAVMEEVYYFQLKPSQGFGFMRVYSGADDPEPFDEAFVVEDGDTILIPRGYHPVVAGPGYQLHYTWALAGEERRYGAWADDPRHAWVKGN